MENTCFCKNGKKTCFAEKSKPCFYINGKKLLLQKWKKRAFAKIKRPAFAEKSKTCFCLNGKKPAFAEQRFPPPVQNSRWEAAFLGTDILSPEKMIIYLSYLLSSLSDRWFIYLCCFLTFFNLFTSALIVLSSCSCNSHFLATSTTSLSARIWNWICINESESFKFLFYLFIFNESESLKRLPFHF